MNSPLRFRTIIVFAVTGGALLQACRTSEPTTSSTEFVVTGQVRDAAGVVLPHFSFDLHLVRADSQGMTLPVQADSSGWYRSLITFDDGLPVDSVELRLFKPTCGAGFETSLVLVRAWDDLPTQTDGARVFDPILPIEVPRAKTELGPRCTVGFDSTSHNFNHHLWYDFALWIESAQTGGNTSVIQGKWLVNFIRATPLHIGTLTGTVIDGSLRLSLEPTWENSCPAMLLTGEVDASGQWGPLTVEGPTCFPEQPVFLLAKGDSLTFPRTSF